MDSLQWKEIWTNAFHELEETIPAAQRDAWLQPLEFVEGREVNDELKVTLNAPNEFSANWVKDQHQELIEASIQHVVGKPCVLKIESKDRLNKGDDILSPLEPQRRVSDADRAPKNRQTKRSAPSTFGSERVVGRENRLLPRALTVDPQYTFDSFVVGSSNQFAYSAAVAVAQKPARQYNPLFLYSSPGLGKTHLLQAVANEIKRNHPKANVAYLSAEHFVNELVESLQHKRMSQFREKYRKSFDVLLIDDIQFIAGKESTEEEFFHTFNALYASHRQIVVTSDRPPKEIESLEARIRTRFEQGLVADIQPPEIETRIAILRAKAERDDIYLPDDVATFLASYIRTNVRELEGILIRLKAQASLTGAEITLEMAREELKTSVPEEGTILTIEDIQTKVAKAYRIKVSDLKSASRAKTVAIPRQIAMYLARKYTGLTVKEIGRHFGGKDHTTVLHALKKIEDSFSKKGELAEQVEKIQDLM